MKPIGAPLTAMGDLIATFQHWSLWSMMGWNDIKARYRGSTLGPLWITAGLAALVAGVGFLYSALLKIPTNVLIPYLAATLVIWNFIMGVLSESTAMFQGASSIMQQVAMPKLIHLFRIVWRHIIIMAHNFLVFVGVAVIFKVNFLFGIPEMLLGLVLVVINVSWLGLIIGLLSARYRDMPQIVTNMLTLITIMTPIYWMPEALGRDNAFTMFNIFNHWLEAVRAPLLDRPHQQLGLIVSVSTAVLGWAIALVHLHFARNKVIHWI